MATQLNYDIVPDKSPLYTTVDQLNQSTTDLQVTAANAGSAPVTIKAIEIELKKVDQGVDTVQLLLPGSEGGIECPTSLSGPGGSNWSTTSDDGKFTLKPTPDGSTVTFQPRDTLSLALQNVVIREGGTGTAFVPVLEASDAGKGGTQVGIGITQSTLNVQLRVTLPGSQPNKEALIEPDGIATLTWTTNAASSGSLTMPGNFPSSLTLDPNTNLTSGAQQVSPILDTTYTLTCAGSGPNVSQQVTISVDSLQMGQLEASAEKVHVGTEVLLQWHTNADSCTLDDGSGKPASSVPPTVPNTDYPNGYPVNPETPTTYVLHGSKRLNNGEYVDDTKSKSVDIYPVQLTNFSSSANAFDAGQTITLSWNAVDAVTCALSTQEGSVNVPASNGQTGSCLVGASDDGLTLIVSTADGLKQELGRLTLPTPCSKVATFKLSAAGVSPKQSACVVSLVPPQINNFRMSGQVGMSIFGGAEILSISWSSNHAGSVQLLAGGLVSTLPSGTLSISAADSWAHWFDYEDLQIVCHGFGSIAASPEWDLEIKGVYDADYTPNKRELKIWSL